MFGVIINTLSVVFGSIMGLIFNNKISKKITDSIMVGVGLCVIYIGIDGMLEGEHVLYAIISIVLGSAIGTAIDLDEKINKLGKTLESKVMIKGKKSPIAQGFVTGSLLFCVGAMAVVGSLNAGLTNNNDMLYTKSLLDMISSSMLAVSLGLGVILSAVSIFVYQGLIVLFAGILQPILSMGTLIADLTLTGSILIFALGFNMIGVTKIKVANYLPSVFILPVVYIIAEKLLALF